MSLQSVTTSTDAHLKAHPPCRVYLRQHWHQSWTPYPYLWCNFFEFAANPSVGAAELIWRYGYGQQPGTQFFAKVNPLDVLDWFVKVEIYDPDNEYDTDEIQAWYGVIVEEQRAAGGTLPAASGYSTSATPTGVQQFTCWGIAHVLDQAPITRSMVEPEGANDFIHRAVSFNLGKGTEQDTGHLPQPNMSAEFGQRNTRVFAQDLAEAQDWNAWAAAQYIIAYFQPQNSTGNPIFDVQVLPGPIDHLFAHRPRMPYEGQTVKGVLDALMDRRRLAGYSVGVEATTNKVWVFPFTYTSQAISLPSGGSIEANADQKILEFDSDVWAGHCTLRRTAVTQYDQVLVRGARRGSVFTIAALDSTLVEHWSEAQQDEYNTAASGAGDYGALPDHEKQRRNDAYRQADHLRRVYSYFGLPEEWNGKAKNGEAGSETCVMPKLNSNLIPSTSETDPYWQGGLRFERHLPLLTDHDYTASVTEPTNNTPAGQLPEQLPMLVAIKLTDDTGEDETTRYGLIDRLSSEAVSGAGEHRPMWSASIMVQQQAPGIIVRIHAGHDRAIQHKLALSDFESPDTADELENAPDLDWRDNLLATVYMLNDSRLEVAYPQTVATAGPVRQLVINVPDAHLDWIAPGTVVAVQDGELKRVASGGGFVRDDRERVKDLAKLAASWYLVPRNCLLLSRNGLKRIADVGDMIVSVGSGVSSTAVNTVVTRVRYDVQNGMTTIETQAGELDVSAL